MESVDHSLKNLSKARILVVGDIMLDRYWFGGVDRVSPEAPVPVVAVDEIESRIGGAANVAGNISSLGANSTLLGIVGDDEAGRQVTAIAASASIKNEVEVDPSIQTTVKLRVVSRNQQLLRADFEDRPGDPALSGMMQKYKKLLLEHDVVVLSDYGKGVLVGIEEMIRLANDAGKLTLVDPKGKDFSRYREATLITPNLKEFSEVVGACIDNADMETKAAKIIDELNIGKLLITLSEKGMALFAKDSLPIYQGAKTQEVYDVSGAGDTVIAVMAMALAAGLDDHDALDLSNSAAGVVVSKIGTATASLKELRSALEVGN
ncbi:MAG: D-glycero-beta-D-manno-heptose-7-phosphate kinase [Gammaproteobacteria bacterium]|nr:D-glycero-beta-D-manno-heptose-7-phosphate kinase [Gammaproteobacteria bacterium]